MFDFDKDGSKVASRSVQVDAPSCKILKFELAQADAIGDKPCVTFGFVEPEEKPDMQDHAKTNLYGKHKYCETTLWFTDNAKSFTEMAMAHILEGTGIKDQFIKEYAESDQSTQWIATAFNRMLANKKFSVISSAVAVWKTQNGVDKRYVNNDGIALNGLVNPESPKGDRVRFGITAEKNHKEHVKWFEFNQDSLIKEKKKPEDSRPTPPPAAEDYSY